MSREAGRFERGLERNAANTASLSPLSFLARAAAVYPSKPAVIHGERTLTYGDFAARCRRLAAALRDSDPLIRVNMAIALGEFGPCCQRCNTVPNRSVERSRRNGSTICQ